MIKLFYTGAGAFNTPQTLASKSLGSYISNTAVPNGVANSLFNPLSVMEFYSKKKITQYIGLGLYLFFFDNEESYDKVDLIFSLLYNEENEIEMNFFKHCFEYKVGLGPISGDSTYGYYIEKITEEAKPFYMLRDFQTLTFDNEVIFENIDLNEKGVGVWISRTFNPKNFKEIFGFNSDYWIDNDKLPNGDFIIDLNINFRPTVIYSVDISSNNLDYGVVNGSGSYVSGTEVEISAIPNPNFKFVRWSDGNTNPQRTIIVDRDIELVAYFEKIVYSINLFSNNINYGNVNGSGIYQVNTEVIISAIPSANCKFVKWSDENTDAIRTIVVENNIELTAYFEEIIYSVNLFSNNSEYGTAEGSGYYVSGTEVEISAIPNDIFSCYVFKKWSDGNTDPVRTIIIDKDIELIAEFGFENCLNFVMPNGGEICLNKIGNPGDVQLEYSFDQINWVTWEEIDNSRIVVINSSQKIYIKSKNINYFNFSLNDSNYYNFSFSDETYSYGNVNSLICRDYYSYSYIFAHLFENCINLKSAPQLPTITLSSYCYALMFHNCTSLVSAPELPATMLANNCYYDMFNGCTFLTSAPELPATILAKSCYGGMFDGCTSLTSAPELPATTLADYCYQSMFNGCTSLTSAPELPATTLVDGCYYDMFWGCTSLVSAPELPATMLADECYTHMFLGCTSLISAPELPATTLADYCYCDMFSFCTSLTSAPELLPATTLANNCYGFMFRDCTSLVSAPELPATTLADGCYTYMFSGCTSLVSAPELPATTLANNCYSQMFNSCIFNMSNDGNTFNFTCNAILPQTVDNVTYSTPYELAQWMGNTHGFY